VFGGSSGGSKAPITFPEHLDLPSIVPQASHKAREILNFSLRYTEFVSLGNKKKLQKLSSLRYIYFILCYRHLAHFYINRYIQHFSL